MLRNSSTFFTTAALKKKLFNFADQLPLKILWMDDGIGIRFATDFPLVTFRLSNFKNNFFQSKLLALGVIGHLLPQAFAWSEACWGDSASAFCNFLINNQSKKIVYHGEGAQANAFLLKLSEGLCNLQALDQYEMEYPNNCFVQNINGTRYRFNTIEGLSCAAFKDTDTFTCLDKYLKGLTPSQIDHSNENIEPWLLACISVGVGLIVISAVSIFSYKIYQRYKRLHHQTKTQPLFGDTYRYLYKTPDSSSAPIEFFCPLTKKLMKDPVITNDGYSYERSALEELKSEGKNCPKDSSKKIIDIFPNHNLRSQIIEYLENTVQSTLRNNSSENSNEHYCCPISMDIMNDPVVSDDGFTYERSCITQWIQMHEGNSPLSRGLISALLPNKILSNQIEKYLKEKNLNINKENLGLRV